MTVTPRRLPRVADIAPLLRREPRTGTRLDRKLARAHTVDDLRTIAQRHTPRPVFDYVDGGADDEISMRRARSAFDAIEFHPRVLRNVADVDTGSPILGRTSALPLILGPTGFTRLMHHAGESAVAAAAGAADIPYALSTMGTVSMEDLTARNPEGRNWFQLYLWRDRDRSRTFIRRAADAAYETLVLTVDVPVAGARRRDLRSGLTIPPTLSARTIAQIGRHPQWWFNLLTTEPLRFASSDEGAGYGAGKSMIDPSTTFDDLAWVREQWAGKLLVKGILRPDDAARAVSAGADGIVVSNHGGRQLDRTVTPLAVLPSVVEAVGAETPVFLDGGVRTGADIVAALCLGAQACFVGRPYLYGLMAGGQAGVERMVDILAAEMARTMRLLGVTTTADLDGSLIGRSGT